MSGSLNTPETERVPNVMALEFWKDYKTVDGEIKEEHWVKWSRRGAAFAYHAGIENVARLKKPRVTRNGVEEYDSLWLALRPAYEAWLQGQAAPVNGTPLDAWSALTKRQVKAFNEAGYRAIEDVADMTDGDLPRVRIPDVRRIRDMGRAFLENKKGSAHIEAAMAKRDAEVAELRAQLDEALSLLKQAAPAAEAAA